MKSNLMMATLLSLLVACDGGPTAPTPTGGGENPPNPQPSAPSLGKPYPRNPIGGDPSSSNPPRLVTGNAAHSNVSDVKYSFEVWNEENPGEPHIFGNDVGENAGETSFQLSTALKHNTRYAWKVRVEAKRPDGSSLAGTDSDIQVFKTPKGVCNNSGRSVSQGIPKEYEVRTVVDNIMRDRNLVRDCRPQAPYQFVNPLMIRVVSELQKDDPCWGYMSKYPPLSPYKTVPRDILAYAWSGESEGTNKFFVIDFVNSGCDNNPSSEEFLHPADGGSFVWSLINRESGTAGNGTWTSNPL